MSRVSAIWKLFTRDDGNPDRSSCNTCGRSYGSKGGTTSSLINHLKSCHPDAYEQYCDETKVKANPTKKRPAAAAATNPFLKQKRLEDCIPQSEDALDKAITDAIVDFLADSGVAFRVVSLPSFHNLMKIANRRIKLKHPTTYSRLVKTKAEEVKQDVLDIISAVEADVSCIGFTTDLWTSRSGHPFMSLTVHFIDKDWELHRWTPFVAPFPARHTGKNISLGLDAMIDDLGLTGEQWDLFAINDNAANVKLGIRLSRHLMQYLCSIHTLELVVNDTFKNIRGMKAVLKRTKALGTFTHASTVATTNLKRECVKENVHFRKIANPPNTRWSGYHDNLSSVLHLKKPLQNLAAGNEDWAEHSFSASEWKLIDGAVKLLKPVRNTVKAWEGEVEPTMHRVIERIYTIHCIIDDFITNPANNMHGIGFARELKQQLEARFPKKGTDNKLRRMANYLAPQFRGIHLDEMNALEDTKNEIELESARITPENNQPLVHDNPVAEEVEEPVPVSPTTKLRQKMQARQQRMLYTPSQNDQLSQIRREMLRYESFSIPTKAVNVLHWWRDHEKVLPCLAKLAKHVLTIPASSAKSERVFSTGGNFVTAKRNRIAPKKVEDLVIIKENKAKVEVFKMRGTYDLVKAGHDPFAQISVDEVLADILLDEVNQEENVNEEENDDEILFVVDYDSDESEENDNDDEETIDIL